MINFLAACGGTRAPQQHAVAAMPITDFVPDTITFQADVAPIRALTLSGGALWIGSARGLRRVRLPAGPAEWVGVESGMIGREVSALATDRDGHLLVGTDAEVGRLSTDGDGHVRYQSVAKLANVTHLGPVTAPAAGDGIWAGTATGLFFVHAGVNAAKIDQIDTPSGGAITSLDVETDGKSAWVGVAARGLYHVDARKVIDAFGPASPSHVDFVDALGTALLSNGTRVAVGRGARGATRLMLLRASGAPEVLTATPDLPALALVSRPTDDTRAANQGPLLIAGQGAAPELYRLDATERGELVDTGAFRFTPPRKNLQGGRVVARPDSRLAPPEVTVAISGGGNDGGSVNEVFAGTRSLGVARLAPLAPSYLPGGELALGARGLSVACLAQQRCVFATGAGPGWIWDGGDRTIQPIPDGAIGGGLMALAGDGRNTVYFVAAGAGKSLRIARLSSDGASWDPFMTLPVEVDGVPIVTFATLSPTGNMWMAVRDRLASGQEFGRGVVELLLPAGRAIHHRPYRERETRPAEAIPVAGDVAAIRFHKGTGPGDLDTTWFCTSLGIQRFVGGQFSEWGESDGLDSETCHDLEIADDGTVWAATEKGAVRFDGKGWRRLGSGAGTAGAGEKSTGQLRWPADREGEGVAATALVVSGQTLWAGTPRGVWPLNGAARPIDRSTGLVDDGVQKLVLDRFGRVWVLGQIGLTIRRPFHN